VNYALGHRWSWSWPHLQLSQRPTSLRSYERADHTLRTVTRGSPSIGRSASSRRPTPMLALGMASCGATANAVNAVTEMQFGAKALKGATANPRCNMAFIKIMTVSDLPSIRDHLLRICPLHHVRPTRRLIRARSLSFVASQPVSKHLRSK